MKIRGEVPAAPEAPGELVNLGRVQIPIGVNLVSYGQDLCVTAALPDREDNRELVGMQLHAAAEVAEPALLNSAARRALNGRAGSIAVKAADGRRLVVQLEPSGEGATALWFDVSGAGISADAERARADELEQAFAAARGLARSMYADEARATICEAALSVSDAAHVALFEATPEGERLRATGIAGAPEADWELPLAENSGATIALRTNTPRLSASPGAEPEGLRRFMLESGTTAAHWQPVARGRSVRALLMLGWRRPVGSLDPRSARLLESVAIEAAVAIDRGAALERLVGMARTDALTGLPNRRCWEEELLRELGRARRVGTPLAIAMLDLDGFKALNDSAGHQVGDALLAQVAETWRPLMRGTDVLARFGGDEFAVALPDCSLAEAEHLLGRLQRASAGQIGFSAGLTEWNGDEGPEALVGRADEALYEAKAKAAGTVAVSVGLGRRPERRS